MAAGGGTITSETGQVADHLWEDNWDDDDVEDDFSKQLKEELAKQSTRMAH